MICTTIKARTPEDLSETEKRISEDPFSLKLSQIKGGGYLRFSMFIKTDRGRGPPGSKRLWASKLSDEGSGSGMFVAAVVINRH